MQLADFTPVPAFIGGVLVGLAASVYLLVNGRVAGISGLLSGIIGPKSEPLGRSTRLPQILFLSGMLLVGVITRIVAPEYLGASPRGLGVLIIAGLLVGFGTRLGNGCTSGHGICGVSRGSWASIGASATFVAVGAATATLFHLIARQP